MFEQIRYSKPYLTEVIARVDWVNPILEIGNIKALPKALRTQAKKQFPIAEPKRGKLREFQITDNLPIEEKETEFTEWNFHSIDRTKTLTIAQNALFVRYTAYESFEVLQRDFLEVVSAFYEQYRDAQAVRLGLRYVNNIVLDEGRPRNWEEYINHQLLCVFRFYPQEEALSRVFHLLELNFGDSSLRFQFGVHNPDYPAPIKRKTFLLDFDAYYHGVQEREDVVYNLSKFHDKIQEIFELSISDKLREKMYERN